MADVEAAVDTSKFEKLRLYRSKKAKIIVGVELAFIKSSGEITDTALIIKNAKDIRRSLIKPVYGSTSARFTSRGPFMVAKSSHNRCRQGVIDSLNSILVSLCRKVIKTNRDDINSRIYLDSEHIDDYDGDFGVIPARNYHNNEVVDNRGRFYVTFKGDKFTKSLLGNTSLKRIVYMLDFLVGLPLAMLDNTRPFVKAGTFSSDGEKEFTYYGSSNFPLNHIIFMHMALSLFRCAAAAAKSSKKAFTDYYNEVIKENIVDIVDAIDGGVWEDAAELWNKYVGVIFNMLAPYYKNNIHEAFSSYRRVTAFEVMSCIGLDNLCPMSIGRAWRRHSIFSYGWERIDDKSFGMFDILDKISRRRISGDLSIFELKDMVYSDSAEAKNLRECVLKIMKVKDEERERIEI